MTTDYFILVAILAGCYLVARLAIAESFRLPKPPLERSFGEGHPLDTTSLVGRVQQVREEMPNKASSNQFAQFKRAQLVENKREQMAKLDFFQPPPPTPPTLEDERQLYLLLV